MGFEALLDKVKQAETALEASEREAAADWRQLGASWRAAWTPGRIIVAGLATGFLIGKLEPTKRLARGNNVLQLLTALSGLFAGGSAQVAATQAKDAADTVQGAAVAPPAATPDALRQTGQL